MNNSDVEVPHNTYRLCQLWENQEREMEKERERKMTQNQNTIFLILFLVSCVSDPYKLTCACLCLWIHWVAFVVVANRIVVVCLDLLSSSFIV